MAESVSESRFCVRICLVFVSCGGWMMRFRGARRTELRTVGLEAQRGTAEPCATSPAPHLLLRGLSVLRFADQARSLTDATGRRLAYGPHRLTPHLRLGL